ncbi:MAG: multi-sensor hybrid histidine [Actinobacteria bacterium]|nr:MAG: multi-sensor hybrid histidine [Actinomycetota bacterium]
MIVLELAQNIALLVMLSVVQQLILRRWKRHSTWYRVFSGLLFGSVAVIGMMAGVHLFSGTVFDGRSIVLGVAGIFGGPVVALTAAAMAGAYRLYLGGGGTLMGVSVIIESALLGVVFYYWRRRDARVTSLPALWGFGLVIHAIMLALTLTLPAEIRSDTFRQIALLVMVLYPIATLLVCRLMLDQEERLESDRRIKESEANYRFLAENMVECMWTVDTNMVYTYVNPALKRLTGYLPEEWIGKSALDFYNEENQAIIMAAAQAGLDQQPDFRPVTVEVELTSKAGLQVPAELTGTVMADSIGKPIGFLGTTRDIGEKKRSQLEILHLNESLEQTVNERTEELQATNEELESANESLAEASEAKTRFLRAMSHELRTPLNSIIGFSDILGKGMAGEMTEEQHRQVEMINNSGRHLLDLVNDILDLSRIEANRLEYRFERIDIPALATEVLHTVTPDAEAKGVSVVLELAEPDLTLFSDARKVRQILLNLLSNAVKFTSSGAVTLRARQSGLGIGTMTFDVADTGPGIAPDRLESIFGEFVQGDSDGYSPQVGTGLGLAISRGLALRLGGILKVESVVGRGSTFTLSLPDQPLTDSTHQ